MTISDRLASVRRLIEEHNDALNSAGITTGQLDPSDVCAKLVALGGTSDERLKALSHEDLTKCFPEHNGVQPVALVKQLSRLFRDFANATEAQTTTDAEPKRLSKKKVDALTLRECIAAYDPMDPTNHVGKRLEEIAKGQPFLVFSNENTVDVEPSYNLLVELRTMKKGRDTFQVGSELRQVYRVGDIPDLYLDENPLYPGRPLRPLGATCDCLDRSWEGIPKEIRQFLRVALDVGDLDIRGAEGRSRAHDLLDSLSSPSGQAGVIGSLRTRWKKAALKFDQLQKTGDLPKLSIKAERVEEVAGSAGPFDGGAPADAAGMRAKSRRPAAQTPSTEELAKTFGTGKLAAHHDWVAHRLAYNNDNQRWQVHYRSSK